MRREFGPKWAIGRLSADAFIDGPRHFHERKLEAIPMKKSDLVEAIAGKAGVAKAQAQDIIEQVFELIADGLAKGEKIDLRGFGTFSVRESAARTGRNPQTGDSIQIPARRVPGFKAGKELRDKVNETKK
jgi:DNA-binding protein HU-beta